MDSYLIDAGAAARLTRLIAKDTFPPVRIVRDRVLEHFDPGAVIRKAGGELPALAELITCAWCCGWWVSAGVVAARRFVPAWWDPVARALAMSMAVGHVVGWSEQEGDIKDLTKCLGVGMGRIADAVKTVGRQG
jgi:hypothetical protein